MSLLDPQNPVPPSTLTADDYAAAAATLACEPAVIQAVTAIEAPDGPFDDLGRPTILFEPRVFSRLTQHQYDQAYPAISVGPVGIVIYGRFSDQYPKLAQACSLDEDAALKSASWGSWQILGVNFAAAGYASVEDMVADYRTGDAPQLQSFVKFVQSVPALVTSIQAKDWVTFALHFNGPKEKLSGYDQKLAVAYAKIVAAAGGAAA